MLKVMVTRTVEEVAIDAQGKLQAQIRVEFSVPQHIRAVESFACEPLRKRPMLPQLEEWAREIEALVR